MAGVRSHRHGHLRRTVRRASGGGARPGARAEHARSRGAADARSDQLPAHEMTISEVPEQFTVAAFARMRVGVPAFWRMRLQTTAEPFMKWTPTATVSQRTSGRDQLAGIGQLRVRRSVIGDEFDLHVVASWLHFDFDFPGMQVAHPKSSRVTVPCTGGLAALRISIPRAKKPRSRRTLLSRMRAISPAGELLEKSNEKSQRAVPGRFRREADCDEI